MSGPPDDPVARLAIPARVGRFEIRSVLGTGNFGRVFLAYDPVADRLVAIKQPFADGLLPKYLADFPKEARAAAQINHHPNVCPVYDVSFDGLPYIVMRFVAGGTLKRLLENRQSPLPVRAAAVIARKIALGLSAAHKKNVIHRDLKPANVLYDEDNREVLITDFGLARVSAPAQAAASSTGGGGTPCYMPPEQWGSKAFGEITPLADVYSLGVILYEMLTGQPPFTGSFFELMTKHCGEPPRPPSELRPAVDRQIEALCLKALAKYPTDRYPSALAFADELAAYLKQTERPKPKSDPDEEPDPDGFILVAEDPPPRPRGRRPAEPEEPSDEQPEEAITTTPDRTSPTQSDIPDPRPTPVPPRPRPVPAGGGTWVLVALGFVVLVALGIGLALMVDRWRAGKSSPTPRAHLAAPRYHRNPDNFGRSALANDRRAAYDTTDPTPNVIRPPLRDARAWPGSYSSFNPPRADLV